MARKSPAFSFYPDSWLGGTSRLTIAQRGVYIELLCNQWNDGPFSLQDAINFVRGASHEDVEAVVRSKFVESDGLFANERLEIERKIQAERSRAGAVGASRRWQTDGKTDGKPHGKTDGKCIAKPMHSVSVSVSVSDTDSEEGTNVPLGVSENTRKGYPDDFERFWSSYPSQRRTKKKAAYAKWRIAVRTVSAEHLVEMAAKYAESEVGRSKYACAPEVWLNKGMYEDDPVVWKMLPEPVKKRVGLDDTSKLRVLR